MGCNNSETMVAPCIDRSPPAIKLPSRRIPELDGLRGLAISLVVILHYFVNIVHTESHWILGPALCFRLAWSGVDLFFVLSGFLIGGILLDVRTSRSYYKTFYARRMFRIMPLYIIWCGLFGLGVSLTGKDAQVPLAHNFNSSVPLWAYPLFLQTIFMSLKDMYGTAWMGMTWSLAIEEQFYLLLPAIVRNFRRKQALFGFAVGMIIVPFCFACFSRLTRTQELPSTRCFPVVPTLLGVEC